MIISNRLQIEFHGHREGRKIALDIIDETMAAIDVYRLTRNVVHLENNRLTVSERTYDLNKIDHIYVLGAGKGVVPIALALEDILQDRITRGLVIEKKVSEMGGLEIQIQRLNKVEALLGGHPLPDEVCVAGAKKMIEIAQAAEGSDLVFFCVQGGCTSLTTYPIKKLSLRDIQETTMLLLHSGKNIHEVNIVRTAITQLSKGRLARYIFPAVLVNLVVNDYVQLNPKLLSKEDDLGWGPTAPVSSPFRSELENIVTALRSTHYWNRMPEKVRRHLSNFNTVLEPPTIDEFNRIGLRYQACILANPQSAAEAAKKTADRMGIRSMILSTMLEGEAKDVGIFLAALGKEISVYQRPIKPPCVVIVTGEKTVTLNRRSGQGGRNQECVVSAAAHIDGFNKVVISSVGTDGTDGPTHYAGGIVDGMTFQQAKDFGMHCSSYLKGHNSNAFLKKLDDAILFNSPGTNVCDLSLVVVTE